ncbi:MAG: hypothetical protein ACI8VR_002205 [Candidatus Azotimanducaceae bacterium]
MGRLIVKTTRLFKFVIQLALQNGMNDIVFTSGAMLLQVRLCHGKLPFCESLTDCGSGKYCSVFTGSNFGANYYLVK